MQKIILASTSKIRQKLLLDLGLDFEAISPEFDEEAAKPEISHLSIKEQALFLARGKAQSISKKYPDFLVIGSDQICELEGKGISKSKNKAEAISQLQKLNNKTHYQNNAVCVFLDEKEVFSHFEQAELKMKNLSQKEIEDYVNADQSWGSAGSYKFESLGKDLFEKVKGNYEAILGMSIKPLIEFLQQRN